MSTFHTSKLRPNAYTQAQIINHKNFTFLHHNNLESLNSTSNIIIVIIIIYDNCYVAFKKK